MKSRRGVTRGARAKLSFATTLAVVTGSDWCAPARMKGCCGTACRRALWFGSISSLGVLPLPLALFVACIVIPQVSFAEIRPAKSLSTAETSVHSDSPPQNKSAPVTAESGAAAEDYPEETQASDYDPVIIDVAPDLRLDQRDALKAEALASFVKGLILEDEGEVEKAIEQFTRVLDIDPGHWELASRLSSELVRRDETAKALDILKNAADARTDDPRPLIQLAHIYKRSLNKPQIALDYAKKALKVAPHSFDPYSTLHEIYMALDNPAKAGAALASAEESGSKDPIFWLRLATMRTSLELDANDPAGHTEKLDEINALFEKALELGPEDMRVLAASADFYVITGQLDKAIPLYRAAIEIAPARMDLLDKLGQSLSAQKDYKEAADIFERMLQLNPLQPIVHERLGGIYQILGETAKAADAFERSVTIHPTDPESFARAARLLNQIKEHDRAVSLLERAYQQFPDRQIELGIELAFTLSMAKKHAEALDMAEQLLIKAEVEQPELLTFQLYYIFGGLAYQAEAVQRAAEFYRLAIKSDPDNAAPAYNDLGYMWVERDMNLDEAGELIRRALELDPESGAYIDSLGWYHYKKGNYEEALAWLLKAADRAPEEASDEERNEFLGVIFDHIGDAYRALGKLEDALAYWTKAIAAQPDLEGVRAKLEEHGAARPAQAAASKNNTAAPSIIEPAAETGSQEQ